MKSTGVQGSHQGCKFCLEEVIESQKFDETEYWTLCIDSSPQMRGHFLAIPKRHVEKEHELSENELGDLSKILKVAHGVFQLKLGTGQYIDLQKNGKFAGQSIPHVHRHLYPVTSQGNLLTTNISYFCRIISGPCKTLQGERLENEREFWSNAAREWRLKQKDLLKNVDEKAKQESLKQVANQAAKRATTAKKTAKD